MMTSSKYWLIAICAVVIGGCGSPDSASESQAESKAPANKEEGVFDPLVGTLDRADSVNDITDSRKDEMDKQIEGAE
jgi:hypothetical protein